MPLQVLRDGKPLSLTATLKEQPRSVDGATVDPRLAGARLAELPEAQRQARGRGVLVEDVAPNSRAAGSGLRRGDVIVAGSGGSFDDLAGFRAGFATPPQQLVLRIVRGNVQGTLVMQ